MFQYLSLVPAGKTLAQADFEATFGATNAAELKKRGVSSVSNQGGRITVVAKAAHQFALLGNGSMRVEAHSSFVYSSTANMVRLTSIKGITVTRPGAPGWVNLDGITIEPDKIKGRVKISSKVSKFLLSLTLVETYSIKDMSDLGWVLPPGFKQ